MALWFVTGSWCGVVRFGGHWLADSKAAAIKLAVAAFEETHWEAGGYEGHPPMVGTWQAKRSRTKHPESYALNLKREG